MEIAFITGGFTLLGTLSGVYIAFKLQSKQTIKEKKQLLVSELEGLRIYRQQLYHSRFEAEIQSDFYEYRYHKTNSQLDLSEAIRLGHKLEDVTIEIAKNNQKLLEIIGHISLLFYQSDDLKVLIEKNKSFKSPVIELRPNKEMSIEQLENWRDKAMYSLKKIVKLEYEDKPKELLKKLNDIL